jgi:hypothetical protein
MALRGHISIGFHPHLSKNKKRRSRNLFTPLFKVRWPRAGFHYTQACVTTFFVKTSYTEFHNCPPNGFVAFATLRTERLALSSNKPFLFHKVGLEID